MTSFNSTEQAVTVFSELFRILSEDAEFSRALDKKEISISVHQHKPDVALYIDSRGYIVGDYLKVGSVHLRMSSDTAHKLWSGSLLMPLAIGTGKVRIKGRIPVILEVVPMLRPAFDSYPHIALEYGVQ